MIRPLQRRSETWSAYPIGADLRHSQRRSIFWLGSVLRTWQQRMIQRIDLADLDDHLIADIGLTRGQVAREASKPFWRP